LKDDIILKFKGCDPVTIPKNKIKWMEPILINNKEIMEEMFLNSLIFSKESNPLDKDIEDGELNEI